MRFCVSKGNIIEGRESAFLSFFYIGIYVFTIHILTLNYFSKSLTTSLHGKLFVYDFDLLKYIFCLFETILFLISLLSHLKRLSFTDLCFVFLLLLYFIPGVVQQAATNSEWEYMIFYFTFWGFMELWDKLIKNKHHNDIFIVPNNVVDKYFTIFALVSVIIAICLMALFGKTLSVGYLILVLNDVYEVRADATSTNVHWLFSNLEFWAAYFSVIATTYFVSIRKWGLVVILIFVNLSMFILEAFRMFVFLEIIAFFIGLFKIEDKKIPFLFFVFSLLFYIELSVYDEGLVFNELFRRFALVPNRISEFYFDYFQSNEPDYLRTNYSRLSAMLGFVSPYAKDNIGHIINNYYIGVDGGMNNGLVGGGIYAFGYFCLLLTTFGYVFVYKLFERYIEKIKVNQIKFITAFFMVSLSANLPYFLGSLLSPSYLLLLLLTFIVICRNKILKKVSSAFNY